MGSSLRGRVLLATAGFYDVETDEGIVRCRLRGRLKKETKRTDLCVIGDWVTLVREGETGTIDAIEERRSRFSRRSPARAGRHREDVMVANLDQIVIVFSFGQPIFQPRTLDRFLVVAEHNQVDALIVANKTDLGDDETEQRFQHYESLGYPVLRTNARDEGGDIAVLRERLRNRVSAFAGPSGVGKSSLINLLDRSLQLETAETSSAHGKGKHTTRVAQLFPLAGGGYIADTPGIRELGTWALPESDLAACFIEFRPFLADCGFRNCKHLHEPRCAIRDAVERALIREERYESYRRILENEER